MIVTGGYFDPNRVSIYNDDGWVENMPSLNSGRRAHGCGHYFNIAEQLVLLNLIISDALPSIKLSE